MDNIRITRPAEIEAESFRIIEEGLKGKEIPESCRPLVKRVIHTTADFEYAQILKVSPKTVEIGVQSIAGGSSVVTDTRMAYAGINKNLLRRFGGEAYCYIDDGQIGKEAAELGITRSALAVDKAAANKAAKIYVIGNAPTALIRLYELVKQGKTRPDLVIGVPVGFVNVLEAKRLFVDTGIPYIYTDSLKGGSNVGAAVFNALLYMAESRAGR